VSSKYVLDANPFIEAKNRYYGFDICPGYWSMLAAQGRTKQICSIDRIRQELVQQNDEVKDFVEERLPPEFFKKTKDQSVIDAFQQMIQWVYSQSQFTPPAKTDFASVADGWVIAHAHVNQLTVVTHEEYAPDARKRVPMPNVCIEFGVNYVDTFAMLRDLGESFIRRTKRKKR